MAQTSLSEQSRILDERQKAIYSFQLQDEDGNFLTDSDLSSLTLTLYRTQDGTIINGRDDQNVLDAANVTVSSDSSGSNAGKVTWTMQPDDNAVTDPDGTPVGALERHTALFSWSWGGTSGNSNSLEVDFWIRNQRKVP